MTQREFEIKRDEIYNNALNNVRHLLTVNIDDWEKVYYIERYCNEARENTSDLRNLYLELKED